MTGHWWTFRDTRRLINRACSGKAMTDDELGHLRAQAMVLLTGPLALDPDDARQLRRVLAWLEAVREEA